MATVATGAAVAAAPLSLAVIVFAGAVAMGLAAAQAIADS